MLSTRKHLGLGPPVVACASSQRHNTYCYWTPMQDPETQASMLTLLIHDHLSLGALVENERQYHAGSEMVLGFQTPAVLLIIET